MMNRPQPGPDIEMENQVNSWLHETDLDPGEAERGLDRLMRTVPTTPQTRRRFLAWWFDRGGRSGGFSVVHAPPPDVGQRKRITLAATAVATGLALVAVSVSTLDLDGTATHTVAADGSGDFETISAAVQAADDGDIVRVRAGTYEGLVVVDKDLTITGDDDGGETIVRIPDPDGPTAWRDRNFAFRLQEADVDLGHFIVQGRSEVTPIFVSGGDVTIHDIVDDLQARQGRKGTSFFGWVDGDATGTIRDIDTRSSLWIASSASPDVLGNRIGGVVWVVDQASPRIVGNELASIQVAHEATPTIEDNVIDQAFNTNSQPAECGLAVSAKSPGPTVMRNAFRNGSVGICAQAGSDGVYIDNDVVGAHTGMLLARSDATFRTNTVHGGQNGIAISDGSPMLEGNSVEGAKIGLLMTVYASPTLVDNTFCGNVTDFLPVVGVTPPDGSNTVCNGSAPSSGDATGGERSGSVAPSDVADWLFESTSCTYTPSFVRPASGESSDRNAIAACGRAGAP